MMAGTREFTVVMADPGYSGQVPRGPQMSVLSLNAAESLDVRKPGANYFVFTSATELEPVARFIHKANSIHHLRALFVRADVDCAWFLPMLERANIRTLRNTLVHTTPVVPQRVLRAWQVGAQDQLIADATVADGRLFLRNCALESFEVAFEDVPALARLPRGERTRFSIDPDGSYLHWDSGDTHDGLDMVRFVVNPEFRDAVQLRRLSFDRRLGEAVKALRLAHDLRQTDIVGLSARQVSRIEAGGGPPRVETLRRLAHSHGMDTNSYLDELAELLVALRSEHGRANKDIVGPTAHAPSKRKRSATAQV